MTAKSTGHLNCTVEGASKLPPGVGGESGVCAVIETALSPAMAASGIPNSAISVAVEVKSESRLSAVASIRGRSLAEQNVATSDRALNATAVKMLADALAAEVAKAATASSTR